MAFQAERGISEGGIAMACQAGHGISERGIVMAFEPQCKLEENESCVMMNQCRNSHRFIP